jgi:hypothetical protein
MVPANEAQAVTSIRPT